MAELTQAAVAPPSCCAPETQQTCCEPSEKSACCGTSAAGGSCGCAQRARVDPPHRPKEPRHGRADRHRHPRAGARALRRPRQARGRRLVQAPPARPRRPAAARPVRPSQWGDVLYDAESSEGATDGAVAASLGCGVPTAVADLHEGETVLDLGSGAGADVLISARRVGPTGRAIGLDMTDEMLELARAQRRRGRRDERRVPQGLHRGHPAPRRQRRRRDLQLRHQPLRRQARSDPRGRARAARPAGASPSPT